MSTDLTFFTNEKGSSLLDRFKITLENNTRFFDVLVGYFRTSGFYHLYRSLEKVEKIRILVERLWRSVKYENVYLKGYQTIPEAQTGLREYFDDYNMARGHQSLGYRTPWGMYSGLTFVAPRGKVTQKI